MAGQYNIISSLMQGIHRYEDPVGIREEIFEDVLFDIRQTANQFSISILDEKYRSFSVQIVDMLGKEMNNTNLMNSVENIFDLGKYSSGMYIYRILCENAVVKTGKIVVEK